MNQAEKIVPKQRIGGRTGATQKKECATRHDALLLYNDAKSRLLDVNNWHHLAGKISAVFQLTDQKGNDLAANKASVGNLIRIKLPAPKNAQGEGYDWVKIEAFLSEKDMIKDEEIFGFRVRPVDNPLDESQTAAHFFNKAATSTFIVMRNTNIVSALERGRNEVPNTGPARLINKVRNVVIAIGALLGLSSSQWKNLVDGILNGAKED